MAQSMADAATTIDRRRMAFGDDAGGVVRLAAGEWVARFLAPRLATLRGTQRDLTVELVEGHADPDLDRREADLLVRHGLPARGHLVRIGLGTVAAAIYGAASLVEAQPAAKTEARWRACPWVAYDAPHEYCVRGFAPIGFRCRSRRSAQAPASASCRASWAIPTRRWSVSRRRSPSSVPTTAWSCIPISGPFRAYDS